MGGAFLSTFLFQIIVKYADRMIGWLNQGSTHLINQVTIILICVTGSSFPFLNDVYLFKANNGNTRTVDEICSKLTIMTTEWYEIVLIPILLPLNRFRTLFCFHADFEQVNVDWVISFFGGTGPPSQSRYLKNIFTELFRASKMLCRF